VKHFYQLSKLEAELRRLGKPYFEFLRIPVMSAGLYVLSAGRPDSQSPHRQDEMYFVVRGRARMRVGEEEQPVLAGSVIFVEAGVEHQFRDIEQDLEVLVFFAPAES